MQTVTVPALVDFEHEGRQYRTGDAVTVAPLQAAALGWLRYVDLSAGAKVAIPVRKRRRYRTRDLTAES